jgi:ribosomal protein S18 acetylase RimI-like enzyme
VKEGLRLAAEQGARQIDLHSGNHRQAAIRLYQRVGFKQFEINVWRFRRVDEQHEWAEEPLQAVRDQRLALPPRLGLKATCS